MVKVKFKNYVMLFVGCIFISFGVAACINFGWGADPLAVFFDGLSKLLNITYGNAVLFVNSFFILFTMFINYKHLGIGTILVTLFITVFVDIALEIIPIIENRNDTILLLIVSYLFLALGIALTIYADVGKGAYEAMIIALSEKLKLKFSTIKFILDMIFLFIGIYLGGIFTISTIIILLILGKLIELSLNLLKKASL